LFFDYADDANKSNSAADNVNKSNSAADNVKKSNSAADKVNKFSSAADNVNKSNSAADNVKISSSAADNVYKSRSSVIEYNDVITISPWYTGIEVPAYETFFNREYGDEMFRQCTQSKCRVIPSFKDADAVLISYNFLNKRTELNAKPPARSNPRQKWIFYSKECPWKSHNIDTRYLELFNATYTYRNSSSVFIPYGKLVRRRKKEKLQLAKSNWGSQGNVAWAVSHCITPGGREEYVSELSRWIDVTIYGTCGTKRCDGNSKTCHDYLQHSYKFYLAFENGICKEYATEKLFDVLNTSMIPIVYGLYDYKENLPENSVIDVRDFSSPKELADYLWLLSRNQTLFETYFQWKQNFEVVRERRVLISQSECALCEYLHATRNDPPVTVNLTDFWGTESNCVKAETFLQSVGVSPTQSIASLELLVNLSQSIRH
jgi:hypothetical protein